MKEFLNRIIDEAAALSLEYKRQLQSDTLTVNRKSQKDLVTEADVAVERFLVEQIQAAYPDHAILGEESGTHDGNDWRWIIDPIDGTTSFVHDQPFYSVSVAVEHQGKMVLGAVHAPVLGELFMAERGKGATLNGQPIGVSQCAALSDAVLGTGFACVRKDKPHNNMAYFPKLMPIIRDVRRYGSAAIDLAYVACGRLDGFWELNLNLFDMAAGMLLVQEAGGVVTDFDGMADGLPGCITAANPTLHPLLLAALKA